MSGPLSLIADFTVLKEHGVHKIYHLSETAVPADACLIFITRPTLLHTKWIAASVQATPNSAVTHHIFFTPKRSLVCDKALEEIGIYGSVKVGEFNLDLIQMEDDLLSLEMPLAFKELYLVVKC